MAKELTTKMAFTIACFIGVVYAAISIIAFGAAEQNQEYYAGRTDITFTRFVTSLNATSFVIINDTVGRPFNPRLNSYPHLLFTYSSILIPIIICVITTCIVLLLRKMVGASNNIAIPWFVLILILVYPAINIIEYLIVRPNIPWY